MKMGTNHLIKVRAGPHIIDPFEDTESPAWSEAQQRPGAVAAPDQQGQQQPRPATKQGQTPTKQRGPKRRPKSSYQALPRGFTLWVFGCKITPTVAV